MSVKSLAQFTNKLIFYTNRVHSSKMQLQENKTILINRVRLFTSTAVCVIYLKFRVC